MENGKVSDLKNDKDSGAATGNGSIGVPKDATGYEILKEKINVSSTVMGNVNDTKG